MSKTSPFFSIVVTTHLRGKLLRKALTSILNQTFQDFEIVLCSDEGSLETKQAASELLREQDTFICLPNIKGPSESRNVGMNFSNGKWLCFLDDDDELEASFLDEALAHLNNENILYYTNYKVISEIREGEDIKLIPDVQIDTSKFDPNSILIRNFIPINCFFVATENAKKQKFDVHLETHEDWDWLIALYMSPKIEFRHIGIFGPKIFKRNERSRNNIIDIDNKVERSLDFLTIYRKWRSGGEAIEMSRAEELKRFGITIHPKFL
jgi:glycosyltransferase involved in cell wall biosynthesis